mmetsp:Transcript_22918/g.39226  ORF Transcript_22918/g.39226 Transcript_22918/m.39226 type:complete len:98 (-) Transcript_22918:827-1120(-)
MFGMGMMGHQPQSFDEHYHCYSMACSGMDKAHLEAGDKIILPASALDTLARLHIEYPMLFQIEGSESGKKNSLRSLRILCTRRLMLYALLDDAEFAP